VNLRLRTAKIVFRRQAFATQYKSGRRKPTVANQRYCTGVSNSHGGLTPAALGGVRLPLKLALPSPLRSVYHGGLTPAALENVRLCITNVVIFQPTRTVAQERLA
jgi:hypothetical protein